MRYELNHNEEKSANHFMTYHKRCRPKKNGDTLPQYAPFKYILTPTGIGTSVSIKCPYCGKEKDITDVSDW